MTDVLAALVSLAGVALFLAGTRWYFRRIRAGRADPVVNPGWPTIMRPTNVPPPGQRDEDWR